MSQSTTRRPRRVIDPNNGNVIRLHRHFRMTPNIAYMINATTRRLIKSRSRIHTLSNRLIRSFRGNQDHVFSHPNKIMRLINNRITRVLRRHDSPNERVSILRVRKTLRNLGLLYYPRLPILFRSDNALHVPRLRNNSMVTQGHNFRRRTLNVPTLTTNNATRCRHRR